MIYRKGICYTISLLNHRDFKNFFNLSLNDNLLVSNLGLKLSLISWSLSITESWGGNLKIAGQQQAVPDIKNSLQKCLEDYLEDLNLSTYYNNYFVWITEMSWIKSENDFWIEKYVLFRRDKSRQNKNKTVTP